MYLVFIYSIPVVTCLICILIPKINWLGRIQVVANTVLLLMIWQLIQVINMEGPQALWGEYVYLDALSVLMLLIIGVISFLTACYSMNYMLIDHAATSSNPWKLKIYYILFNLFLLSMLKMVTVNSLGGYWIAIESSTIFSTFLVGYYTEKATLEAAWKYVILCTVGISFALIGIILTYYAVMQADGHIEQGLNFDYLISIANTLNPDLMKISFIFIFIGFGTKAGLAPMHNWLPDAHSQAPTPVSALLSGVLLKCAIYGLIRYGIIVNTVLTDNIVNQFFIFFGLLSFCIAVPFMLIQTNIKRLFAYSSLKHIGLILTGLGFGGSLAVFGALFHMFNHALVKTLMFFTAGNLARQYHSKQMENIRGVIHLMPITGLFVLFGGLALAGMPPFSLFLSEFYMIAGGIQEGYWFESIVCIIGLFIVFSGLTYSMLHMTMGPVPDKTGISYTMIKPEMDKMSFVSMILPFSLILMLAWWFPPLLKDLFAAAAKIITEGMAS